MRVVLSWRLSWESRTEPDVGAAPNELPSGGDHVCKQPQNKAFHTDLFTGVGDGSRQPDVEFGREQEARLM